MWVEGNIEPALTQREQQVLELVANGYSAKEVAHLIGIAPRTVERHIENVRLKMRARNRAHMVTQAIMAGLLKIGPAELENHSCPECLFRFGTVPKNRVISEVVLERSSEMN